jgi:hypothetical protein
MDERQKENEKGKKENENEDEDARREMRKRKLKKKEQGNLALFGEGEVAWHAASRHLLMWNVLYVEYGSCYMRHAAWQGGLCIVPWLLPPSCPSPFAGR